MPRTNKEIDKESEATIYSKPNEATFNVRSRRKSNSNNIKKSNSNFFRNRTRINGRMSSDSESSTSSDSSNISAIKPSNNNDNNNTDINSGSYIPRRSNSKTQYKIKKKNKKKQDEWGQFVPSSLSGRKRKRSREYQSDFDNISMFNRNNKEYDDGINIHYELPSPQRQQILGYNEYNVGDDIYLILQEYSKKYQETLPVINTMHKLSDIADDIMTIQHFCQNTGYLDGKIIGFYKPSSMYLHRIYNRIDIDFGVLRNWRMIIIEIVNTNKQIVIHDIHDNNGQSHLSEYILSDLQFLESIQQFERGDIVTMKGNEYNAGYGRILEIAAIDENKYKLSPYKCLSIIGLNDCNKIDITRNGQKYYRCSPWEVNKLHNINISKIILKEKDDDDDEVTEKKEMIDFIQSELIAFLPCHSSVFSLYFKKFEDIIQDIHHIFDPSNKSNCCLNLERRLYGIAREISYKYLCLDCEIKRNYNNKFIAIIERIITLSLPIKQQKMISSVKHLAFPQINQYHYHY